MEPYFDDQLYGTYGFQLDDEVYYIVFPKDETKFYFYDLNKRIFVSGSIIEFENNVFQLDSSQNAYDIIEKQRINYNQQCINIRVYGEAKEFKKISNASYRADSLYTQYY